MISNDNDNDTNDVNTNRTPIVVGVSGNIGSFSEEVASTYLKKKGIHAVLTYLLDMDNVLNQLTKQKIDMGLFPVFNNNTGIVHQAFQAMGHYEFVLIDYLNLQINHSLMALPHRTQNEIKEIVSHSQAIAQCQNYISKHFPKAHLTEWIDTAEAAKDLAEGKLSKYVAIIAPKKSSKQYGLKILFENIQDKHPNITTFVVVKKPCTKKNHKNRLEMLRDRINSIDQKIIGLLSERNQTSLEIGQYKVLQNIDIYNEEREQKLKMLHKEHARKSGLDEKYIESLFKIILSESRRVQKT